MSFLTLPPPPLDTPGPSGPALPPPKYRLSRRVTTVPDLWREWTVGFAGSPPVQALNNQWGSLWRKGPGETQYYCTRKVIINEIISHSSCDRASEKAVRLLKTQRNEQCAKLMSLDAFERFNARLEQVDSVLRRVGRDEGGHREGGGGWNYAEKLAYTVRKEGGNGAPARCQRMPAGASRGQIIGRIG